MVRSKLRYPWLLGLALVPACAGDGCTSGCGGITPLPGGFVSEERIENAAAVRITPSGLDFIQDNLGNIAPSLLGQDSGIVTFAIPQTQGTVNIIFNINYTICSGNQPCNVEIDLANANLNVSSQTPSEIRVEGTLPVRLASLPISTSVGSATATLTGNQACPGSNQTFANVGVRLRLSVVADTDTSHARYGYSRIRIDEIFLDENDIEDALRLNCGGFLGSVLDFVKGLIVGQLMDGLTGTLDETVEEQLCQAANPAVSPPCPTGTNDVDGICRYGTTDSAECVSMVLGTDGNANLGGLLAGISPGTKGGLDFLLAAGGDSLRDDNSGRRWGDLNPIGGGATLGFYGGVEPKPVSGCVPLSNTPRPTGLLIPNELIDDALVAGDWPAGLPGPHLGLGISESFLNYAFSGMYNSGLLCIGLSTETVDLLNSTTLGLLAPSLRDLSLQREEAPIAIVLKPQKPPVVALGNGTNLTTDPLLDVTLDDASFDFYILSHDRFIRFMTATFDLRVPLNLTVTPEGLVPVIETIGISNGQITNAELMREDPAQLAASLEALLSGQIGGLIGSGLPAIDLNDSLSSLGLRLVIPESVEGQGSPGLRKLVKEGEDFLGIFAAFEVAGAANAQLTADETVDTTAQLVELRVDPLGLKPAGFRPGNEPEAIIAVAADSSRGAPVEHQLRVDGGAWRPWTRGNQLRVSDPVLRLEGRHVVELRSREVGRPYTLDPEPARVELLVDTQAPAVRVRPEVDAQGEVELDVYDQVSQGATQVRWRFDDGEFGAWVARDAALRVAVPEGVAEIEIEARDEQGQLGTTRQALIRGLPKDAGDSACSCSTPGSSAPTPPWSVGLGVLGVFAALARLGARRARRPDAAAPKSPKPRAARSGVGGARGVGGALVGRGAHQAVAAAALLTAAGTHAGCSCDDDTTPPGSNYKCESPCVTLEPGLVGSYTSTAVSSDGTLWVAGYLEADYNMAFQYGDLVVGRYDGEKVDWQIVDGVPSEPEVNDKDFNREGFRGGQIEPGDDVGLWTSIALDASGQPAVSYYDRTNRALKFARLKGVSWEIERVDGGDGADAGRYSKLLFDGDRPTIAYLSMVPTDSGFPSSKVRLARGAATGGGFLLEDVSVDEATPCRARLCTGGSVCAESTGECAAPASGCANCGADEQCLALASGTACAAALPSNKLDSFPLARGLYVSLGRSSSGLVVSYYDRIAGTLSVAREGSGGWEETVVDGLPSSDGTPADVGVGASMFVDGNGDVHLSYVDGYAEALRYARVVGTEVEDLEVVDDGLSVNGVPFPDGLHVVGDDSNIRVTPSGEVRIAYQDATNGKLRYAVGTPKTGGHDWTVKVVDTVDFGGFFPSQVELSGSARLVSWGRRSKERVEGDVTVQSP